MNLTNKLLSYHNVIDTLQCKRKVILNNQSTSHKEAKLPTIIIERSRAKRRFQKRTINYLEKQGYNTISLKNSRDKKRSHSETIQALNKNEYNFIINACIIKEDKIANYDFLRKIKVSIKNKKNNEHIVYAPGIISDTSEVTRNQLIELCWNLDIINEFNVVKIPLAFVINKTEFMEEINIQAFNNHYLRVLEEAESLSYQSFEQNDFNYPAQHCKACGTCKWRYLCVPEIIKSESISLLPEITQSRLDTLKSKDIIKVDDLLKLSDNQLMSLNFDAIEIKKIKDNASRIQQGKLVFNKKIKKNIFENSIPLTVSFRKIKRSLVPTKILYYLNNKINYINLEDHRSDNQSIWFDLKKSDIKNFQNVLSSKVVAYGTDYDWLKNFSLTQEFYNEKYIDLTSFIESYLYTPILGMELTELEYLYNTSKPIEDLTNSQIPKYKNAYERLKILIKLVDCLKKDLE